MQGQAWRKFHFMQRAEENLQEPKGKKMYKFLIQLINWTKDLGDQKKGTETHVKNEREN